ncbi:MAG: ABC transporter permease subunit [Lysobacteraceae bacterium]
MIPTRFRHLLGRVLEAALTLWLLLSLCFVLLRLAPGGPFDSERSVPDEVLATLNAQYRLDQPVWQQYQSWLGDLSHGDLGPSFQYPDHRVSALLADALPVTLMTGSAALLIAVLGGLGLGMLAARHHGGRLDRVLMALSGLGLALPKYVVAPLMVLLFAVVLRWLPAAGWGDPAQWVLPVLALALPNLAVSSRLVRAAALDALHSDALRAARARGLSARRLWLKHVLPLVALPLLAWLSPAMINLVSGSAVVEQIFSLPGMGRYFVQGALNRDYTLVMGVVAVVGVAIVAINTLVDVLRAWIDPRLR